MGIDEQRREAVERLKALTLEGGSHEMLSAIARAVMPDAGAWTVGACRGLRDRLVALIGRGGEWARGYDEGFASADDWLAEHEDEMAEHGWVRGPLDADGKMWRSGDMSDSNWGVIEGIAYEDGRWLISGHDMSAPWIPADSIRHHHEPTVEDVMVEFAIDWECAEDGEDKTAVLKEYAAKLRLAGDAE